MLNETTARADVNHNVGGSERGMPLATMASFGFMAQNDDDAVQRYHGMRWETITKMIDREQKMIDVKMKLVDSMVGNRVGDQLRMSVIVMMDKIDKWNEELGQLMNEKRVSSPIVGHVLKHSAHLMGMTVASKPTGTVVTETTNNLKDDSVDLVASVPKGDE